MRKLILFLMLSGCAHITHKAEYENMLKTYMGHTSKTLFEKWGIPYKSVEVPGGGRVHEYRYVRNGATSYVQNLSSGDSIVWGPTTSGCKTTFYMNESDKIYDWRYEGNYCRIRL